MRHFGKIASFMFLLALTALVVDARPAAAQTEPARPRSRMLTLAESASLGVNVRDLTPDDAKAAKAPPSGKGAYVTGVAAGSAAEKAGIKEGDVIVEFDGEQVRSAAVLSRLVTETPAGRDVKVAVMRDGKRLEVSARLQPGEDQYSLVIPGTPWAQGREFTLRPPILRLPDPDVQVLPPQPESPQGQTPGTPRFAPPLWQYQNGAQLGVTVQELTPQLRDYFGVRQGVLVAAVAADSAAARAGVKAGDVITTLDKTTVRTSDDLRRLLGERRVGDRVTLAIVRDHKPMTLTVTLEGPQARVRPI